MSETELQKFPNSWRQYIKTMTQDRLVTMTHCHPAAFLSVGKIHPNTSLRDKILGCSWDSAQLYIITGTAAVRDMMQTHAGPVVDVAPPLTHLIAGGSKGMDGVAVAAVAACAARNVPRVRGAAVAVLTHHVGLAGTLAAALIALAPIRG